MLEVNNVSKWYDDRRGVEDLQFAIEQGEIVGFLGPNGAGKTTTMRMITGYLNPTRGSISIGGLTMAEDGAQARSKIGYLPETPPLYPDMSVKAYLSFIADLRGVPVREQKQRIAEMLDKLGLRGREKQMIRSLSKGYKQRLGLAQAIMHKPDLLVLDEPTSGLDPNQIIEIRELIRELGEQHTVLLSTHILPEVNTLCNRVLIIHQGRLVLDERQDRLGLVMGQTSSLQLEVKGQESEIIPILTALPEVVSVDVLAEAAEPVPGNGTEQKRETGDEETESRASVRSGSSAAEAAAESGIAAEHAGANEAGAGIGAGEEQTGASQPDSGTPIVALRVIPAEQTDARESIFFALAKAGHPILEMKRDTTSLEDVFIRLTTEEEVQDA
ncbi:ABC transporter ATP-binding protein [Paenibacillus thiaminolyticus]|uniref:ABC transporter ATP-binding protein n=1 Tax=Paenibacillus thiaminolyticus TaxID=49283 RepID=A0AAP9DYA4_PANTH|nr:ABC transporter ATP-binding protein [Paenibacillus thiaminolyticus]MCY9537243.1 ABC transporter ATP-binding protein [Paenibacillus thiaminolyticus]MCY9600076.1 ABC transporter ATP-binding protein [Paenibacillus thiaminolyticus]MCY9610535.1 ABC transporter ATP-binding protein [Paenibacillus thiaminolyticus]MCY9615907.1 ABC transporter ATP-binding protein [Paenibacillus thiaminolyticus]MCY9617128.1 ABC transporter ATP-binding protein [Paenibacillus thiaminolyticus]